MKRVFPWGVTILSLALTVQGAAAEEAFTITRFHEPGVGSVNTWILEDGENVVIIDAQRTYSAGTEVARIVAETGKPLRAILITHPHPDHVGGIPSILASHPDAEVFATPDVNHELEHDTLEIMAFARRVNGDAFPAETPVATQLLKDGQIVSFGEIELLVNDIGPGESIAMTAFYSPQLDVLFAGDFIDNDMLGFVFEQRSSAWLDQLDEVRLDYPTNPQAYPGHGADAPLFELLDAQGIWLRDMRDLVNARLIDGEFTEEEVAEVWDEFQLLHPDQLPVAPIDGLGPLNLRAVAEELLAR